MEGTWADTNGKHIYTGNQQVKLTDMQMTDVQRFLETHGFKHVESTSGSYSPANEGESTYRHGDGRNLTLRQKMGASGVLSLEGATGIDISGGTKSPLDTIGELKNFVELGRSTNAPTQGGIEMDEQTAKSILRRKHLQRVNKWYPGCGHMKKTEDCVLCDEYTDTQPGQGELAPQWVGQGNLAGGQVKVEGIRGQQSTFGPETSSSTPDYSHSNQAQTNVAVLPAAYGAQGHTAPAINPGAMKVETAIPAHAVRFQAGDVDPATGKREDHADGQCPQIHPTMTHPEYEAAEVEHAVQGQPAVMSAPQVTQQAQANPTPLVNPQVKHDEAAAGNDPHSLMAQSVAGQPMALAHQTLQRAGYTLLGTDGEIGGTLDHTYQSGEGHKITVSSKDGATVTGIKFDQPKPQVAQAPGYQGLYGAGAGQQGQPQQPQQRQDVPSYGGGAAAAPAMGMKSFYNRYTKTWMPKGSIWDPVRKEWTIAKDLGAVIPTGLQPSPVVCDWHHGVIPLDNSEGRVTFVDFKGLRVCRKCWNELGPRGHFVRKN